MTRDRLEALARLRFPRGQIRIDDSVAFEVVVSIRPWAPWRLAARVAKRWARRRLRARLAELRSDVELERPTFLRVVLRLDLD